ncbi:hypothetical protein AVEN_30389-1 [Araneus ventricosus]|uniref:Uncharacterized protein n=2 Tax=Araneus ventricosus TaxID=182803 RepID=A0A4Y2WMA6_ARAVE|nr:hypothetical protein AVEN_30389-1 [Araneus ventricosus]
MSFYITCPSDGSLDFHPENTLSHYFTKLPSPVDLTGEWEVGIVEFIYPRMWNNVTNDSNYYEYNLGNGVIKSGRIACGYYETPIDILNALPKHVKIQMNYNKHSKKVKLQLSNGATLKLSDRLSENLGFVPGEVLGENVLHDTTYAIESPFIADPNIDLYLLYIYTDIIQPEMVGGVFAPLLRIVTVKGKDGDMIHEIFDRPHYCPVSRKNFQSIEIVIRTHTGRFVSFDRGKLIVKLHFRLKHL